MDYNTAKKNLEKLLTRMKRDLTGYAAKKDASAKAVQVKMEQINTMINFFNAAEELIAEKIAGTAGTPAGLYQKDDDLENTVLAFFGLNDTYHREFFIEFSIAITHDGKMDHFKKQLPFYIEFKNLAGFKHGFFSFLGHRHDRFQSGKWNAENWEAKLAGQKSKIKPAPVITKETAIERRNRNLAAIR